MDTNSGRIYETEADIAAARSRGETLVPLSSGIASQLEQIENRINAHGQPRRMTAGQYRREIRRGMGMPNAHDREKTLEADTYR